MKKIMFVCHGNICRSPMAEFIMKDLVEKENLSESHTAINTPNAVTRRILALDANRLLLIFAQMICVLVGVAIYIASFVPPYIFSYVDENGELILPDAITNVSLIIMFAAFFFILFPLLAGYSSFAMKTARGEKPSILELFSPFRGPKKYFASFCHTLIKLTRLLLVTLPAIGGVFSAPIFWGLDEDASILAALAESAFVLFSAFTAVCVGAYLASFLFFAPYLMQNGMGFIPSLREAFRMSRTRRTEITKHTMSHTPSTMAGVLSFGVLALIHTIPKMSVSYCVFCDAQYKEQ